MKKMKVIFKQLNPEKFAELIFDMKECLSAKLSLSKICVSIFLLLRIVVKSQGLFI